LGERPDHRSGRSQSKRRWEGRIAQLGERPDHRSGRSQSKRRWEGRIAQLGERRPYKPEVAGSIPVPPTIRVAEGDASYELRVMS
jgi:hypothetical protein